MVELECDHRAYNADSAPCSLVFVGGVVDGCVHRDSPKNRAPIHGCCFFFFDAWGVDLGTLSSVEKKLQVVRWVSGRPI